MCGKFVSSEFDEICRRLDAADSVLIVTHERADGDALGSMAALGAAAAAAGKTVCRLVPDRLPQRYRFLFPDGDVATGEAFEALADQADVVAIVDTCAVGQLDGVVDAIRARREKVVVVDHHRTADDLGAVQWLDSSAAAAGSMVLRILRRMNWPMTPQIAEALMVAITTDTGWLHFANTDSEALAAVAECVQTGVRPDILYKKLFQTDRPERLKLVGRVLESLELHCGGVLAAMTIRKDDFHATGATYDETENLVNEALRIASVETAVIVVQNDDCVRVSLRSRDAIDVAAIAREFGGGGHRRAAGLRTNEDIDALKARLIDVCTQALREAGVIE